MAFSQAQEFPVAYTGLQALLKHQPSNFDMLHLGGIAAVQAGHPEEGVALIRRASAISLIRRRLSPRLIRPFRLIRLWRVLARRLKPIHLISKYPSAALYCAQITKEEPPCHPAAMTAPASRA
jgi:hypothetical protein